MTATIKPEDALRDVLLIQIGNALDTVLYVDSTLYRAYEWMDDAFPDSAIAVPTFRDMTFTSAEYTSLETIAELCPYEYGPAVYMARAMMLRSDSIPHLYSNICEANGGSFRWGNEQEEQNSEIENHLEFNLYPNPNTGAFTVWLHMNDEDVAHIQVWNMAGQRVYNTPLNNGTNALNINVAQGLYLYAVTVNGTPKWTGKVAISSEY